MNPPAGQSIAHASGAVIAFLRSVPRRQPPEALRGCPVRLLATALTVVPLQRDGAHWVCLVLTDFGGGLGNGPAVITVTEPELSTGLPAACRPLGEVDDVTFATLWQAQVRQHSPDPVVHRLAELLVDELAPGSRVVDLYPTVTGRLVVGLRMPRPSVLMRLLRRLADHGLVLLQRETQATDGWGSVRLVTR